MKKIIVMTITLFMLAQYTYSQRDCSTTFNPAAVQVSDNARYQRYLQMEQFILNYKNSLPTGSINGRLINANSLITIPVVVHILHNGEAIGVGRNISVAQIQSQIDVLNEDFRRLNANRVNTPSVFQTVAADPTIQFALACIDPNGNATTGISRKQTTITAFTIDDKIKFTAQGGEDAWPTSTYFNIWVSYLQGTSLLGYSQFPIDYAAKPNTDGVVIRTTAFGRVGNVLTPFALGRTATHEIGHSLGLFHLWGDVGGCTGSDFCNDTPPQSGSNSTCPAFPSISCSNGPNGDMFMNYLDYTDDGCMNIFTNDQRTRMRAMFSTGGVHESIITNAFSIIPLPPSTIICNTATISLKNIACISPVAWTISGPASIAGNGNTATITRSGTGSGIATVTATAGGYTDSKTVTIGDPANPTGTTYVTSNYYYTSQLQIVSPQVWFMPAGQTGYVTYSITDPTYTPTSWSTISGNTPTISIDKRTISFSISTGQTASYQVTGQGPCGTFTKTLGATVLLRTFFSIVPTPNPTSENLRIKISDESKEVKALNSSENISISLYEFSTNTLARKWQFKNNQKEFSVKVTDLKSGQYILVVTKGKYKESTQIMIGK